MIGFNHYCKHTLWIITRIKTIQEEYNNYLNKIRKTEMVIEEIIIKLKVRLKRKTLLLYYK